MDGKQRRPINIDGVYDGRRRVVKPTYKIQPERLASAPVRKPEVIQPKLAKPLANPQENRSTLLNMSIPNPQYTKPLDKPPRNKRPKKRFFKRDWSTKRKVVTSMLVILVIGFGLGGYYGAKIVSNVDKVFHGNIFSDASALFSSVQLKGEASGRVNILVAGDSSDQIGHGGADLTDSIMVLSIDTKNHTAFMLSIPRDLWVNIPGVGNEKINAANDVANFSAAGYPSGGMGQLEQVVQTQLGIPIDYYALVNYGAFRDSVNAVGGITIDIQSSDPRGLYDSFTNLKLPNGEDTLNGQQALDLARARGDGSAGDQSYGFPDTDFDRTQHQREMVVAILKKADTAGVLANPIKVSGLFSALGNNVQTDMNLQDVLALAKVGKGLNLNTMGSYTYSSTTTGTTGALLTTYTDPDSGEESLIPTAGLGNFDELQQYYKQLTSSNPVVKEGANVTILNGSDVVGLAKYEEDNLNTKGIDNVNIADAYNEYPKTMIVDNSGSKDPATKALLQQMFPGTTVTSDTGSAEAGEAQGYTSNFVVILGQNWDGTNVQQP